MHGRTDDGRKVITIAHPEQSSGELKIIRVSSESILYVLVFFPALNFCTCLSIYRNKIKFTATILRVVMFSSVGPRNEMN